MSMDENISVKMDQSLDVVGCRGRGRPRNMWIEVVRSDLLALGLARKMTSDPDLRCVVVSEQHV